MMKLIQNTRDDCQVFFEKFSKFLRLFQQFKKSAANSQPTLSIGLLPLNMACSDFQPHACCHDVANCQNFCLQVLTHFYNFCTASALLLVLCCFFLAIYCFTTHHQPVQSLIQTLDSSSKSRQLLEAVFSVYTSTSLKHFFCQFFLSASWPKAQNYILSLEKSKILVAGLTLGLFLVRLEHNLSKILLFFF